MPKHSKTRRDLSAYDRFEPGLGVRAIGHGFCRLSPQRRRQMPAELLSGRIPPHWVHGIARLESHQVPRDVPAHRWHQFINDCHKFLMAEENWAERSVGHGWNDLELFGCCRRPLERLGSAGLLWAISGGRLVELRRDWAVIERASDRSRHVHQRERPKAANITLPWIGLR